MNPDVAMAIGCARVQVRPAFQALWGLDDALGRVLTNAADAMIARIRLAWWREALERLDREPPPREPVLEGLHRFVLPREVAGAALAGMEAGWSAIIGDDPITAAELDAYAAGRGGLLFRLGAALLGGPVANVAAAGEAWALVDLARHSTERSDIDAAIAAARARPSPRRWPKALRPLGMLAVLAQRDLAREPSAWEALGAPPRAARMLRHRLTGW